MSIFPPLLDIVKDLSDLIQSFINFLCVHLPGIVCMTGMLVQVVSYAGQQSNQLAPFLGWCFSHLTSFDQSAEIGFPAQSALFYIGI